VFAEWSNVAAGDLAGYRIYADGVEVLDYLEGGTSIVVPCAEEIEVTLTAVDISGNESDLSDPTTETPLAGEMPVVELTATAASGVRNDVIELAATGAETYDWDVDGDGVWDFTDDATGMSEADTNDLGVIRPAVRAHTAEGGFSLNAISLFITGNFRPVVLATADVTSGPPPLDVNFAIIAEDDDGTIEEYAWDFDGDGTFDDSSPTDPSPLAHSYPDAGMYNAKFRATDNDGAWAIDTVAVQVADPANMPPVAILTTDEDTVFRGIGGDYEHVTLDASGSSDPEGTVLQYAWDPDGNGAFGGYGPDDTYDYAVSGNPRVITSAVRVQDEGGAISEATCQVNLYRHSVYYANSSDTNEVGTFPSLANVGGMPAVAHYDYSDDLLLYSIATSLPATSEDCWATHVVDDGGDGPGGVNVGYRPSLCVVGGLPAIAYYDWTTSQLKFARANTQHPNSTSDWSIHVVDNSGITGDYPSMTSFTEGFMPSTRHTVISYYDSTTSALKIARTTGTPTGPGDWTLETIDNTAVVGGHTSITAIWDGMLFGQYRVGICHYDATNDNLRWALSNAWPPTAWFWDVIDDGGGNNVGQYTAMYPYSSAGGFGGERFPLITYFDDSTNDLKFAQATVAYPVNAGAGHWNVYTLEDGGTGSAGRSSSVIWYHGEPMVLYNNGTADELWLARAMNSAPADESEWWKHLVAVNFDPMNYRVPLMEFEDKPIFAAFSNTSPPPSSNLNFGWPVLY